MKIRECIIKVGVKKVILYESLYMLEIVLNAPYLSIRGIGWIISETLELIIFISEKIQDGLYEIFKKRRIICLSNFNKKINEFRKSVINELKNNRR